MSNPDQATPASSSDAIETKFERIDELVSLLVDEAIDEQQVRELEQLLTQDGDLRGRYVGGIQLHCDLLDYYSKDKQPSGSKPASPVLGFLGNEDSGIDLSVQPPNK